MATATSAAPTGAKSSMFDFRSWGRCIVLAAGWALTLFLLPKLNLPDDIESFFTVLLMSMWAFAALAWITMPRAATVTGVLMGVAATLFGIAFEGKPFTPGGMAIAAITTGIVGAAADYQYARHANKLTIRMFFWTALTAQFALALWSVALGWINATERDFMKMLAAFVTGLFTGLHERVGAYLLSYFVLKFFWRKPFTD